MNPARDNHGTQKGPLGMRASRACEIESREEIIQDNMQEVGNDRKVKELLEKHWELGEKGQSLH